MTAATLIRELDASGIRIAIVGDDQLSLRGPRDRLSAELADCCKRNKAELLRVLVRLPSCCECGAAILEAVTWWGGGPCHRDCGEVAFRRTWEQ
jgi:hypothetical protein